MIRLLCCCVAFVSLVSSVAALGQATERYYIVNLGGERAGWTREAEVIENGLITTTAEMRFAIKRGPIEIDITLETEFVETEDHEPVSMRSTQAMGAIPVDTVYVFEEGGVRVTTRQAGQTSTRLQAIPGGDWVTPARASEISAASLAEGNETLTLTVIDPSIGLVPVTTRRSEITETSAEVLGKTVPGYRVVSTSSIAPGSESIEFIGLDGELLRATVTLGGMEITTIAADKEIALADIDPPEIMRSTFIKPSRTIRSPRETTRGVYLLSVEDGPLPDLPQTASQSVERVDASTVKVSVTAEPASDRGDPPTDADLASSTMIACTDEAILALVERSSRIAGAPPSVRAEALRRFVHSYVDEKSLGVGFATASEVARTRVGDCSEHAALLAAVLRADGIPSRVVSGLIYAQDFIGSQDIFGYHMWTQAYVDTPQGERWVDLDATLPPSTPTDATHIALDVSTLSDDDTVNAMIALAPLLGTLSVKVESVE
ncbi:MAG: transglutaminase domain-containing protein [Planctomycetota bacterium]